MVGMLTPIVTERELVLQPVLPNTFVYLAVREGDPRPGAASQPPVRRVID
jgi:hypothetical protein